MASIEHAPTASAVPGRHAFWAEQAYVFFMLGVTTAGAAAALALAVIHGVAWFYIALFGVTVLYTTFGVTAGLHRYFSHKSFRCKRWFEVLLAALGISAGQDFFIRWVYVHRVHHRNTDVLGDPHSPYFDRARPSSGLYGLYYSHIGWLFHRQHEVETSVVPDLVRDPLWVAMDRYSPLLTLLGLLLPGGLSLLYQPTAFSFVQGVLWGGFARLFLIYHVSWGVNSLGHYFGPKVPGQDHGARNNIVLGVITLGDGWHANHHEYASSARHGFGWQLDLTYLALRVCERLGWVWDLKLPPQARQETFAAACR